MSHNLHCTITIITRSLDFLKVLSRLTKKQIWHKTEFCTMSTTYWMFPVKQSDVNRSNLTLLLVCMELNKLNIFHSQQHIIRRVACFDISRVKFNNMLSVFLNELIQENTEGQKKFQFTRCTRRAKIYQRFQKMITIRTEQICNYGSSSTGTRPRSLPMSRTRLQGGFARQSRSNRIVKVSWTEKRGLPVEPRLRQFAVLYGEL